MNKSIRENLLKTDKQSFGSMTKSEIADAVAKLAKAGTGNELRLMSDQLLLSQAQLVVSATTEMLPDLQDEETAKAVVGVLMRSCQNGDFDTAKTIEHYFGNFIGQLRERMVDRMAFIVADARAENFMKQLPAADETPKA